MALVPKKRRKVSLPENEEAAARIFEKHRSMAAQQPGGLPDHQARVCSAKEPVRTSADLARLKCASPSNPFPSAPVATTLARFWSISSGSRDLYRDDVVSPPVPL
ncbi:hypothetical protein ZWY2020_037963 [Hordeum vulgare]|nr:hypothetical protein ZWY2020_037963 [Hordeum vulgare]